MCKLRLCLFLILGIVLSACSSFPEKQTRSSVTAFRPEPVIMRADRVLENGTLRGGQGLRVTRQDNHKSQLKPKAKSQQLDQPIRAGKLAGRVMYVSSANGISLKPKEVVLTFDDGPHPKHTPKILATLRRHGVKATFFMLGTTAKNHPALARRVASQGHTVAHHTWSHPNLRNLSRTAALDNVRKGRSTVQNIVGTGQTSRFFRFPYLADSKKLRAAVTNLGNIIVDVDVDSKDYFKSSPDAVRLRTMSKLRKRGRGVILFHDIHGRTATMLDAFLNDLKREGYKVVTMRSRGSGREKPDLVASNTAY